MDGFWQIRCGQGGEVAFFSRDPRGVQSVPLGKRAQAHSLTVP